MASFIRKLITVISAALVCSGCSSSLTSDHDFKSYFSLLLYQNSQTYLVNKLGEEDIQFVKYGDTMTLVIPTDSYFEMNAADLNDISGIYLGLNHVVALLKQYPKATQINVIGFTDDMSHPKEQKKLTYGRAVTIATYLWANGIPATALKTDGYGDIFPLGSNRSIHASAYNRRVEIQWSSAPPEKTIGPNRACQPSSSCYHAKII